MTYPGMRDLKLKEETLFEVSRHGRKGYSLPVEDLADAEKILPEGLLRKDLDLPELSEIDVARHYTRLPHIISASITVSTLSEAVP